MLLLFCLDELELELDDFDLCFDKGDWLSLFEEPLMPADDMTVASAQ